MSSKPAWRKRVFKILSKVATSLYWCDECNLPLLTRRCGICSREGRFVKLTPPADARPVLGVEIKALRELIKQELGSYPYPRRRVMLLNKVPYPDFADEVIIDGHVVGHRYYDVVEGRWRFKPLYVGASELIRKRVGYYAITNLPKLARNYEIHKNRIVEANLPPRGSRAFVAVSADNGYEGIGVLGRGGRIRVVKSWKARDYKWGSKDPTWIDVVKANEARLSLLEREAIEFLREVAREKKLPPVVSFSGGKDSLVAYRIAEKALGKVPLFFNNTGLELPKTVEYVKWFSKRMGAKLIVADAGDSFWKGLEVMGPPARDYRWCCKVAKLAPTARTLRETFGSGALSIVGQRRLESAARALSPRVYRNRWLPDVVVVAPILKWSSLEVWLYIFKEKLRPNPLYFLGFDRLGCWLCPALELGEAEIMERLYPKLWNSWLSYLESYAREKGLPHVWVRWGLWRWIALPGHMSRLLRKELPDGHFARPRISAERRETELTLFVDRSTELSEDRLATALTAIGPVAREGSKTLRVGEAVVELEARGRCYVITVKEAMPWEEYARAIARAALCVKCGFCEIRCPQHAIRIESSGPTVDFSRCTHCGTCNNECPVAEYVMKILDVKALREEKGR